MSNKSNFYICERCGNLVEAIHESGVSMMCCGQKMTNLNAATVEASREKHIPVVEVSDSTVRINVGSVEHPMSEEHSILWVYLLTDRGCHRRHLEVGAPPVASFDIGDEKPIAAYAYCNLHGLWKQDISVQ